MDEKGNVIIVQDHDTRAALETLIRDVEGRPVEESPRMRCNFQDEHGETPRKTRLKPGQQWLPHDRADGQAAARRRRQIERARR